MELGLGSGCSYKILGTLSSNSGAGVYCSHPSKLSLCLGNEWTWACYSFTVLSANKSLLCKQKGNCPTSQDI